MGHCGLSYILIFTLLIRGILLDIVCFDIKNNTWNYAKMTWALIALSIYVMQLRSLIVRYSECPSKVIRQGPSVASQNTSMNHICHWRPPAIKQAYGYVSSRALACINGRDGGRLHWDHRRNPKEMSARCGNNHGNNLQSDCPALEHMLRVIVIRDRTTSGNIALRN